MRSGEELVPMSEDQLRSIFAEGEPDWLEQTSMSSLSAEEVVQLLDTQTYFDLLELPYPPGSPAPVRRSREIPHTASHHCSAVAQSDGADDQEKRRTEQDWHSNAARSLLD